MVHSDSDLILHNSSVLIDKEPQFKTETAVQYIYSRGFTAPYELGYASALSSVLFIIVATIAISTNVYMSRKEKQMK
ncbi:sugar ABC transporter permease [Enterococcus faecium]|nr:sugar ABC transporter permease [Enterococcus faecium]